MRQDVIVIGGGIAGLQCGRELRAAGREVLVLERARGVGGRCATRRFDGQAIDLGPLFLHGHAKPFLRAIAGVAGAVMKDAWPRRVEGQGQPCQPSAFEETEQRMVLPAGLNTFAKHLAEGLEVRLRTDVAEISPDSAGFSLRTSAGEVFTCQDLVVALALEETRALLGTLAAPTELAPVRALLDMFASVPSLTLLAAYPPSAPPPDWDLLYPDTSDVLQLVAQDSSKREQPRYLTLVLQGRPRWSRDWLEAPAETWSAALLEAAAAVAGPWVREPLWSSPHRWRYARVDRGNELARPLLIRFPQGARLGLAGDVFAPGGGVQAAWLSGSALAQRFLHEER